MAGSRSQGCNRELNITTLEEVYKTLNDSGDIFAIFVVYPLLLTVGILTNGAFFIVIIRLPRMRTITNIYLVNLAIADVMFLIVAISDKLFHNAMSPVPEDKTYFGLSGCVVVPFIVNCTYFASIFTITLVSVEKFYAICKPLKHRKFSGMNRTIKLIVGAWIVSVVFSCCFIPGMSRLDVVCMNWPANVKDLPSAVSYCCAIEMWSWFSRVVNFLQTVPFFIAMVMNTILYTKILRTMHMRVGAPPHLAEASGRLVQIRNQVGTMLVANGVVFFLGQMLFQGVSISLAFQHLRDEPLLADWQMQKVTLVARIFSYMNSAINSIVYNIFSSRYRRAFKDTFCWRKRESSKQTRPAYP